MFASWRVGVVQSDSAAGRTFDAAEIMAAGKRSSSHLACNNCRARKLRCNGAERGCLRCQSTQTVCTYPDATSTPTRPRKKGKPRTSSRNEPVIATDDARKSPVEGAMTTSNAVEPQDPQLLDAEQERWYNESDQCGDWPFVSDTDFTWPSLVMDSAVAFGELQDNVVGLASPSSSAGLVPPTGPSQAEEQRLPSPEAAHSGGQQASGMGKCNCLRRSASILDQLNAPVMASAPATTDQLIASYRSASQVLHGLQDCASCSSRSEVMIIVVMVLQQALALCELMVERQVSGTGSEDCELRFGRILVTTIAERDSLSHALISAQCRSFAALFETFKARAAWMPGPLAVLRGMEPRVASIQAHI